MLLLNSPFLIIFVTEMHLSTPICMGALPTRLTVLFHCRLFFLEGCETSPWTAFLPHPAEEHSRADPTASGCPARARPDRLGFQVCLSAMTVGIPSVGERRTLSLRQLVFSLQETFGWCKSKHTLCSRSSELRHFNILF